MNTLMLKQKKKKKEQEMSIHITQEEIAEKLIKHFQFHIGRAEKTTPLEIFTMVTSLHPKDVDSYSRFYWWEIIQKVMKQLRTKNKCFIIREKGNFFVLKEQDEADYYRSVNKKAIGHMENAINRADDWVEKEKWRDVADGNVKKVDIIPATKSTNELIDKELSKAERKIIKVYSGETEQ
jgi:hypothetical protein